MTKLQDVLSIGKFSEWIVLEKSHTRCGSGYFPFVVCECSCGTVKDVRIRDLLNGRSKSCGGKKHNCIGSRDGDTNHRLFNTWSMMRVRCNNPKYKSYKNYGALGIKVCKEWEDNESGFRNFLNDMESSYQEGLTLDRIDSSEGYSKENCHWATRKQQANNCKSNSLFTIQGLTMSCGEWASLVGITTSCMNAIVRRYSQKSAGLDFKLPPHKTVYHYKGERILTVQDLIERVKIDNPSATRHSYSLSKDLYMTRNNVKVEVLGDQRSLEEVYKYLTEESYNPDWVPEDSLYIKDKYKYYEKEDV